MHTLGNSSNFCTSWSSNSFFISPPVGFAGELIIIKLVLLLIKDNVSSKLKEKLVLSSNGIGTGFAPENFIALS